MTIPVKKAMDKALLREFNQYFGGIYVFSAAISQKSTKKDLH